MNNKITATLVGLTLVLAFGLWFGVRAASAQVPADIVYEDTKGQAPVTFSHKAHVTDKKLQCPACHMNPKLFEMKKGAASPKMSMAAINKGEFCGSCHDGKKAFAGSDPKQCATCHKKK